MTTEPTEGDNTPPCSPDSTMCGGTPDDCWNHAAVNGRCYRGVAYVDRLLIALEAHGETVEARVTAAVKAERDRCTAIVRARINVLAIAEGCGLASSAGARADELWAVAAGIESGEPA